MPYFFLASILWPLYRPVVSFYVSFAFFFGLNFSMAQRSIVLDLPGVTPWTSIHFEYFVFWKPFLSNLSIFEKRRPPPLIFRRWQPVHRRLLTSLRMLQHFVGWCCRVVG